MILVCVLNLQVRMFLWHAKDMSPQTSATSEKVATSRSWPMSFHNSVLSWGFTCHPNVILAGRNVFIFYIIVLRIGKGNLGPQIFRSPLEAENMLISLF